MKENKESQKYIEYDGRKLVLMTGNYVNGGGLALYLKDIEEGPYARMTVNIPNCTPISGDVILDTNNFPEGRQIMEEYGLGKWTGNMVPSGFCWYPIYTLNMDKIREYEVNRFN